MQPNCCVIFISKIWVIIVPICLRHLPILNVMMCLQPPHVISSSHDNLHVVMVVFHNIIKYNNDLRKYYICSKKKNQFSQVTYFLFLLYKMDCLKTTEIGRYLWRKKALIFWWNQEILYLFSFWWKFLNNCAAQN